jgi:hypothetical protein
MCDGELMDRAGRHAGQGAVAEGSGRIARLHAMLGMQLGEDADGAEVLVGSETDRASWVVAQAARGLL